MGVCCFHPNYSRITVPVSFFVFKETENDYISWGTNSDHNEEAEYLLRDILQDPTNLSSESEAILPPTTVADGGATTGNLANSNSVVNSQHLASETTTPTACILSFEKSVVIPDIPDPSYNHSHQSKDVRSYSLKPKRTIEMLNDEPSMNRGTKKSRSGAGAMDHIMAERRRRQELTEKFIALSATIPGLKKIDKASILSEAISTPASSEVNSGDRYTPINDVLPDVKARMSDDKQVLIRILCKKQDCIMLKILDELKNLNLSVFGNSVIPFGSSTLDVTVVARMSEDYSVSVKDVVKSLRIALC
ncbi:transcription factor bHLH19-like [Neltuma alba]|uniref:transcription factor bHLH19-like n=1 Tax=Neltuma alba TaxID=207710 RepID=UPI0010A4D52B|nr:transcription factor bHLH19-like [Prosopis alba]